MEAWARMAIPGFHELSGDDTALVMGEHIDELYVIGLLNRKGDTVASSERLSLSGGTYAEATGSPGSQTLQVFSGGHELLFEYDEENGKARIHMESGDLEFVAKKGNIAFTAGRDIMFHGRSIGVTGCSGILLGIMDAVGQIRSAFTLQPQKMNLNSPELDVSAQQGKIRIDEAGYIFKKLSGTIGCARLVAERLETAAQTVIEKAKNVYKTVEQLSQLKAGRMRTLVNSSLHLKARKIFLKSEDACKIRADKIHLG
jgi:hypothetical protein